MNNSVKLLLLLIILYYCVVLNFQFPTISFKYSKIYYLSFQSVYITWIYKMYYLFSDGEIILN